MAGRFLGLSDPGLDASGRRDASHLASQLGAFADASIVSSPARRALETAELLGLSEPVIEDGFREIDFGAWEGLTLEEVAERDPLGSAAFDRGDIDGFPGGESVASVQQRTTEALIRHRSPDLVVITHATVIRILVAALLGLPVARYRALLGRPANLSRTEFVEHDGGWRLISYDRRDEPTWAGPSS